MILNIIYVLYLMFELFLLLFFFTYFIGTPILFITNTSETRPLNE
jgi:hypothetical protein